MYYNKVLFYIQVVYFFKVIIYVKEVLKYILYCQDLYLFLCFFCIRYVDRVKQIVCKVVVNEDLNVKIIREFKEEVVKLREILYIEGIQFGEGKKICKVFIVNIIVSKNLINIYNMYLFNFQEKLNCLYIYYLGII